MNLFRIDGNLESKLIRYCIIAEVQEVIAEKLEIPAAPMYGVLTFYSFFTMISKGKFPISICTGTACNLRVAETVLSEFKKQLEIEVGDKTYGRVAPDHVEAFLEVYNP